MRRSFAFSIVSVSMPFRAYSKSRGRAATASRGRFRKFVKGATTVAKAAYSGFKLARKIYRLVNVEKKYLNTTFTGGVTNAGQVTPLNLIGHGDTAISRNGDSILALSLECKGFWQVGSDDSMVRYIVVHDKQCNGATPAVTDILESASVVAHQNMDNVRRFHILHDVTLPLETNHELVPFNYSKTFNGMHLYYSDGDADAAALKDSALFLLVIASNDLATDPQITSSWRLTFTDN